jgi:hypothetical protein
LGAFQIFAPPIISTFKNNIFKMSGVALARLTKHPLFRKNFYGSILISQGTYFVNLTMQQV